MSTDKIKRGDLAAIHLRKSVDDKGVLVGYVKTITDRCIVMSDGQVIEWTNVDNTQRLVLDDCTQPQPTQREVKLL